MKWFKIYVIHYLTEGGAIDMKVSISLAIIIALLCSVVLAVLGFFIGLTAKRKSDDAKIANATEQATKILNDALSEAEKTKKAQLMEAKDEIHKLRSDADKEIRERRNEVQKQEKRLNQREEYSRRDEPRVCRRRDPAQGH